MGCLSMMFAILTICRAPSMGLYTKGHILSEVTVALVNPVMLTTKPVAER